jgi:hypothetical protein
MENEAGVKHPSPAEIPDKMFLDRKKPAVDCDPVLLPHLSDEETNTPPVGSSLNPITFDDNEDESTNVTPDVLPELLDLKTPTVACVQEPIPCLSLGTAATFPGTTVNPITFNEDENAEEKAVAAMPAAMNHSGLVSVEDTNRKAGTVMPSMMNDSGSASIACRYAQQGDQKSLSDSSMHNHYRFREHSKNSDKMTSDS